MRYDYWSFVLLAGLWGWIISTIVFIFRSFPERGVFDSSVALKWGVCVLLSFSIWIVGLLKA